jgi:hypothetical protein
MTDPERAAGRRSDFPVVEVGLMCPSEPSGVGVVVAEHVRRAREELEILCLAG